MVQEVVGLDTELKLLRFRDGKVLEQPHVPVKVSRSISHRKQRWPILPNGRRRSETAPIDVLMGTQAGQRIASYNGVQLHGICAQDGFVVDGNALGVSRTDRARNDRAIQVHAEI